MRITLRNPCLPDHPHQLALRAALTWLCHTQPTRPLDHAQPRTLTNRTNVSHRSPQYRSHPPCANPLSHGGKLDAPDIIKSRGRAIRSALIARNPRTSGPTLSSIFSRLCAKSDGGGGAPPPPSQNAKIKPAPEGPGVGPQARSASGKSMSGVELTPWQAKPFC